MEGATEDAIRLSTIIDDVLLTKTAGRAFSFVHLIPRGAGAEAWRLLRAECYAVSDARIANMVREAIYPPNAAAGKYLVSSTLEINVAGYEVASERAATIVDHTPEARAHVLEPGPGLADGPALMIIGEYHQMPAGTMDPKAKPRTAKESLGREKSMARTSPTGTTTEMQARIRALLRSSFRVYFFASCTDGLEVWHRCRCGGGGGRQVHRFCWSRRRNGLQVRGSSRHVVVLCGM